MDAAGGNERALTSDGGKTLSWGAAEFVAQEELGRDTGYWWSPDDRYVAVARVDESPVAIVKRAAIGASGTELIEQRYPVAGHQERDRRSVSDDSRRPVAGQGRPWQPIPTIYLARVDWAKDGRSLYVQRLSRDQKRLDMLRVDPATGRVDVAVLRNLADLGQPHRQFQAAEGRQPDLVVGAQRLFASLSLEGRQVGPADARRMGRRGRRRRR